MGGLVESGSSAVCGSVLEVSFGALGEGSVAQQRFGEQLGAGVAGGRGQEAGEGQGQEVGEVGAQVVGSSELLLEEVQGGFGLVEDVGEVECGPAVGRLVEGVAVGVGLEDAGGVEGGEGLAGAVGQSEREFAVDVAAAGGEAHELVEEEGLVVLKEREGGGRVHSLLGRVCAPAAFIEVRVFAAS